MKSLKSWLVNSLLCLAILSCGEAVDFDSLAAKQCRAGRTRFCQPPPPIITDTAIVSWNANSEPDLAGYRIYYGWAPGDHPITIDAGNAITKTLGPFQVTGAVIYVVVTAYNTSGLESGPSLEVSKTL